MARNARAASLPDTCVFRRDRSERGQKLFLRNVCLRRYRGDDRHAARQFFDACRIVVVDLVRLIYDERQRLTEPPS